MIMLGFVPATMASMEKKALSRADLASSPNGD